MICWKQRVFLLLSSPELCLGWLSHGLAAQFGHGGIPPHKQDSDLLRNVCVSQRHWGVDLLQGPRLALLCEGSQDGKCSGYWGRSPSPAPWHSSLSIKAAHGAGSQLSVFYLPKASGEIWGCILGRSGGAASDLQGHLGHRETQPFCKPLSTGEPQTLTLCGGQESVQPLRGRVGPWPQCEQLGLCRECGKAAASGAGRSPWGHGLLCSGHLHPGKRQV